jgi:hypothetical protein
MARCQDSYNCHLSTPCIPHSWGKWRKYGGHPQTPAKGALSLVESPFRLDGKDSGNVSETRQELICPSFLQAIRASATRPYRASLEPSIIN